MLNKLKKGDVRIIKTVLGEEVIGKIHEVRGDGTVVLDKVGAMAWVQKGNDTELIIIPYMPWTTGDEFEFPKHSYIHVLEPVDKIRLSYQSKFSGIIAPPQSDTIKMPFISG